LNDTHRATKIVCEVKENAIRIIVRPNMTAARSHCESKDLGVAMLPEGETVELVLHVETQAPGCRLDAGANLADLLAAAIEDGADLVIINRCGRSEAEGKGLIDLFPRHSKPTFPY
jgi:hypothetical protein